MKPTEQHVQIAATILDQMGGRSMVMMTGTRYMNLVKDDQGNPGVEFRLPKTPGFAKDSINSFRVILTPADLYDLSFARVVDGEATVVATFDGIYADQMPELFRETTGLETRPPFGMGKKAA